MKIPAFWAKATAEDQDRTGKAVSFSCWRSSDQSREHAHESALAAARRALQSLIFGRSLGRYAYGETPMREETIERFMGSKGQLVAAVTRNAYGSLVLNTDRIMFIDWDSPPPSFGQSVRYFFARMFNKAAPSPAAQWESEVKDRLEKFLGSNGQWGLRLYRTRAGFRGLVTHDLFAPASPTTLGLLETLGSDPLYIRLCKVQKCFRARLTPKPWRCGHSANRIRWPLENGDEQARFEHWQSVYKEKQSRFATCHFLGTLGDDRVHPEIAKIVEVHDQATRCNETLELA